MEKTNLCYGLRHIAICYKGTCMSPRTLCGTKARLNIWALALKDGVTAADVAPYEIIEFPIGMFLVATAD